MNGTLEGTGPNKLGTTGGSAKEMGMGGMGGNATTNPPPTPISPGIRGGQWKVGSVGESGLENAVIPTNDTQPLAVPGGTLEGPENRWMAS